MSMSVPHLGKVSPEVEGMWGLDVSMETQVLSDHLWILQELCKFLTFSSRYQFGFSTTHNQNIPNR